MKLMIDIDDNLYSYISKEDAVYFPDDGGKLFEAVKNGTELPKGHGRLIDADALIDSLGISDRDIYFKAVIEEEAPTIIEADKEDKEWQDLVILRMKN